MLREHFVKGLRPVDRTPRNSGFLTIADNVLCRPEGTAAYPALSIPISGGELTANGVTIAFPFPQLYKGKEYTLLLDQTAIFTVDESTWTLTAITTYDYATPANTKAITAGGPWHVADFWGTIYLSNGQDFIIKTPNDAKWYIEDTVGINTCCKHLGRLSFGGFGGTVWSSAHKTWLQGLMLSEDPPNAQIPQGLTDVGQNWIWYSTIGGGDVEFLFNLTYMQDGYFTSMPSGHSSTQALAEEFWCRNEWGFMPMTFQGKVLAQVPLGQHMVVYGEDGINILTAAGTTYGLTRELHVGIDSRSAVSSNGARHLFVDDGGDLWQITADLQIQRMDYNEYLLPMIGSEIVITENQHQGWATISDENVAYAYVDGGGLSKIPEQVTSQFFTQGGEVGIKESYGTNQPLLVTDTFDMDIRGDKEILGVEIGGAPDVTMDVAIDRRRDSDGSFVRSEFYPVNTRGAVQFMIVANEFRVVLRPTIGDTVDIDYVQVKWRPTDKSFIRGPHGPGR